jgi:hypothetical protein
MPSAEIKSIDGGDLITSPAANFGGIKHWSIKRDWRLDLSDNVRREGDTLFWVVEPVGEQPFPSGVLEEPIVTFYTGRRPNGQIALFALSQTKIWRFYALEDGRYVEDDYVEPDYVDVVDGDWILIASGLSVNGHRWEVVDIDGWVIFNNDADLPLSYRLEQFEAVPIHEMREQGIAKVGTICNFNGVLMCADITEVKAEQLAGVMNGVNPYGEITDATLLNRIQYRLAWPHVGQPLRWAATVLGTIAASSTTLTLEFPVASFKAGQTLNIAGAGPLGNNLIATILAITGTTVLLGTAASTAVTDAPVQRSDAAGMIVGFSDEMQDDGSGIIRMGVLKNTLVILKDTSFWIGVYTGDPDQPFVFVRTWEDRKSERTIFYRWCMESSGDYLVFAGRNRFWKFDLTTQKPVEHPKLLLCENLFYDEVEPEDSENVFSATNGITGEAWFIFNGEVNKALAYSFKYDRCNVIGGYGYTAAATIKKPVVGPQIGPSEDWFIMSNSIGTVLRYGKTNRSADADVLTRIDGAGDAQEYDSVLRSNLGAIGNGYDETRGLAFVPVLSEKSADVPLTVRIYIARNPLTAPTLLGTRVLNDPFDVNLVTMHTIAQYIADEITVTGTQQVRLASRTWDMGQTESHSAPRAEG